jgi:hypothetical protein
MPVDEAPFVGRGASRDRRPAAERSLVLLFSSPAIRSQDPRFGRRRSGDGEVVGIVPGSIRFGGRSVGDSPATRSCSGQLDSRAGDNVPYGVARATARLFPSAEITMRAMLATFTSGCPGPSSILQVLVACSAVPDGHRGRTTPCMLLAVGVTPVARHGDAMCKRTGPHPTVGSGPITKNRWLCERATNEAVVRSARPCLVGLPAVSLFLGTNRPRPTLRPSASTPIVSIGWCSGHSTQGRTHHRVPPGRFP